VLLGALVAGVPTASAATTATCQLSGTQTFSPGLTLGTTEGQFAWAGATLSGCQGSASAPAGGTVTLGGTGPVVINGVRYQPPPAGDFSGSDCQFYEGRGTAIVQWAGGGVTVLDLNPGEVGTAFTEWVSGQDAGSIRLTRVDRDANGNKVVDTISTDTLKGAWVQGVEVAAPTGAAGCAGAGLTSVSFNGALTFATTS
jgi:hypothetical protein